LKKYNIMTKVNFEPSNRFEPKIKTKATREKLQKMNRISE